MDDLGDMINEVDNILYDTCKRYNRTFDKRPKVSWKLEIIFFTYLYYCIAYILITNIMLFAHSQLLFKKWKSTRMEVSDNEI